MKTKDNTLNLWVYYFSFLLVIFLISCKDDLVHEPPVTTENNEPTPVIWKFPEEDNTRIKCGLGHIYQDILVHNMTLDEQRMVVGINIHTGEELWRNTEDLYYTLDPFFMDAEENLIVIGSSLESKFAVINMDNGKTVLKKDNYGSSVTIYNGWVYSYSKNNQPKNTIYRHNISTGETEPLFTYKSNNDFYLMTFYIYTHSDSQDEICMVNTFPSGSTRIHELLAYNITADSMLWKRESKGSPTNIRPVIEGDFVYLPLSSTLYCINAKNGKEVWKNELGFTSEPFQLHVLDNKIIYSASEKIYAVDKMKGTVLWDIVSDDIDRGIGTVKNGIYWYPNGHITSIDIETGEKVYSPWRLSSWFYWDYIICSSPNSNYIYGSNGYQIYCIDPEKLPDI